MSNQNEIVINTKGRGTYDVTDKVADFVTQAGITTGLCHVFNQHTSASLILCENADPVVRKDLERLFSQLVPDGSPLFQHTMEGPDDMPAHARSVLTTNSLTIPIVNGDLGLGVWQGIYLWEHRHHGHQRRLTVTILSLVQPQS